MIVKDRFDEAIINSDETLHIKQRRDRVRKYSNLLSFKMLYCFRVDNNHPNGDEIHCINEYGLIYIYNYTTKRFITILHPRPRQLKRYFRGLDMKLPNDIKTIIDKCYKRNINSKLNEV